MKQQRPYTKCSTYPNQHLSNGQMNIKSDVSECLEEKDYTRNRISQTSLVETNVNQSNIQNQKILYTLGYHPVTKNLISNDKSNSSNRNSPIIESFRILDQVSTSKDKDFYPFWNNACKEISEKLPLPIKTGYADSDSSSLNGSLKSTMSNSWYTLSQHNPKQHPSQQKMKWHKIFWPFVTTLLQKTMGCEHNEIEKTDEIAKNVTGITKYKLKLKPNQKVLLNKWMGAYRWTYNKSIEILKGTNKKMKSMKAVRSKLINRKTMDKNEWILDIPWEICDEAIRLAIRTFQTEVKKLKRGETKSFELAFKKKKCKSQTIFVRHRTYKNGVMFPEFWNKSKCSSLTTHRYNNLPASADAQITIQKEVPNSYYVIFPKTRNDTIGDNQTNKTCGIVAGDPGVRVFYTFYDNNGIIIEVGKRDIEGIIRLCIHVDKLVSELSRCTSKRKRYTLKTRVIPRVRNRIQNMVSDLHHKLCKYLCDNYSCIIIPKFDVSRMVNKKCRCIRSSTVRRMLTWSHHKFRKMLLDKSKSTNVTVDVCTEEYTSKTRGCCGTTNNKLGGSKINICRSCHTRLERDWNGARNILIKRCVELLAHHCGLAPF